MYRLEKNTILRTTVAISCLQMLQTQSCFSWAGRVLRSVGRASVTSEPGSSSSALPTSRLFGSPSPAEYLTVNVTTVSRTTCLSFAVPELGLVLQPLLLTANKFLWQNPYTKTALNTVLKVAPALVEVYLSSQKILRDAQPPQKFSFRLQYSKFDYFNTNVSQYS